MQRCSTCRFWGGRDHADQWSGQAECHRYPPTTGPHPRGGTRAVWVETGSRDWCGEHQPEEADDAA